jgi:hypothetical protein
MAIKRDVCCLAAIVVISGFIASCSGLKPPTSGGSNPVPAVASLSPNSASVGSASFTLTVSGTNFVSLSTVHWNGSARSTTLVSSTQLQAQITSADIAAGGTASVTVSTPAPGGGTSSALTFAIGNPSPTAASMNPSSAVAGGAGFTLTVNGTNFISLSTVNWNGSARPTTFVSSAQLQAQITAADIATSGTVPVTVSTPTPGGGTSSALTFTVDNPSPTVASMNPTSAGAGGASFTLTVTGTNFIPTSTVQWNGSTRSTTFVSSTSLQVAITAADISAASTASVTVLNPSPGGGASAALTFTITPAVTAITLLTPGSAIVGGASFTLAVTGNNFVSSSTVLWNGSARPTTFVSSSSLQAAITAADIAAAGVAKITVSANGGTTAPFTFLVGTSGGSNFALISITQAAKDLVYDPVNQVLYLSVTGTAATHPNTICILNPTTATVSSAQPAGSNPNVLAISDDSQFLYAGIDGSASVQRFTLPSLATDINYPLPTDSFGGGPFFALDLQVAPGAPHTTAVTLAVSGSSPAAQGGITIFDDSTARLTIAKGFGPGGGGGVLYDSLQWGSSAATLLAANNEDTGFDFYTLSVNSSGVTLNQDFPNAFNSFTNRIHFDAGTQLVYADDGHAVNASTGAPAGNFNFITSGRMVPDSTVNKAFFLTGLGSSSVTISAYDLKLFSIIDTITVSPVVGTPQRLIRWGQNGLAFNTDGGQIVLIGGNFVK